MLNKIITSITILCIALHAASSVVVAQSATLSISPPVVEILIAPNKTVSQTFKISTGESDVTLIPEIHLVRPSGDSGHVEIDPSPINESEIPLVITSNPPLNIPFTAKEQQFTLNLEAASSDIAQDVYLALVFRAVSSDHQQNLDIGAAISALILTSINPSGIMTINLEIADFEPRLIHDAWIPLSLAPSLANKDSLMIRPEGTFEILAPSGKSVYKNKIHPNLILGSSSRKIEASVDSKPTHLSWQPSWNDLGPHRLLLTINTQGGSKITEVERVIWILPIRLIIILCTIIFLLFLLKLTGKKHLTLSQ